MEGERVMKAPGEWKKENVAYRDRRSSGCVLVAYLGLCAWVGTMDRIFPNTTIAGLDVSA